jgi:hypothetical protein
MGPKMRHFLFFLTVLFVLGINGAFAADQQNELSVEIKNKSEPEVCAEKDNVALEFSSPTIRAMTVQAVHPSYMGMIVADRYLPDFTSCDMSSDPAFASEARRVTFYETPELWLTGYTYPSFWRPGTVPVKVGNRVENGLHVVQLWVRFQERAEEVLVFYPPDGYWRARPLPPAHLRWSAYGSSFLVGPVETQIRPIVDLKEIVFEPEKKSFLLTFKRGGQARLSIKILDQDRMVLDVSYENMPVNYPFAAMRSMYVTRFNNDVADVAWREKQATGWNEAPMMQFQGAKAAEIWAGRHSPSRHNLSAPDMVFGGFKP